MGHNRKSNNRSNKCEQLIFLKDSILKYFKNQNKLETAIERFNLYLLPSFPPDLPLIVFCITIVRCENQENDKVSWFLTEVQRQFKGEKLGSSTNDSRTTRYHM